MHGLTAEGPNRGAGNFGTFLRSWTFWTDVACMRPTCSTLQIFSSNIMCISCNVDLVPFERKRYKSREPRTQVYLQSSKSVIFSKATTNEPLPYSHLFNAYVPSNRDRWGKHVPTFALYISKLFCSRRIEQIFTTIVHGTFRLFSLFHAVEVIVTCLNSSLSSFLPRHMDWDITCLVLMVLVWEVAFRVLFILDGCNIHDCLARAQTSMVQFRTSSVLSCANSSLWLCIRLRQTQDHSS